jgi:hypothetical protein
MASLAIDRDCGGGTFGGLLSEALGSWIRLSTRVTAVTAVGGQFNGVQPGGLQHHSKFLG